MRWSDGAEGTQRTQPGIAANKAQKQWDTDYMDYTDNPL